MSGLGHWKSQRVSSLVLIPLTAWLLWACVALAGADYDTAVAFFSAPLQAIMAVATAAVMVYHAQSGVTVVCEDYVSPPALQTALIWLTRLGCLAGVLATLYVVYAIRQGG
jgi:succinate dehydrogenase / fumarate reductase membrane anchor subunit